MEIKVKYRVENKSGNQQRLRMGFASEKRFNLLAAGGCTTTLGSTCCTSC
jgi:hypothetical protein